MKPAVCILNYGSGNVQSVYNLLEAMGVKAELSNDPQKIQAASHLILPGVGAFGAAMEKIKANLPMEMIADQVLERKKPFLGICVGMQVLADKGYEFGEHEGLAWIPGEVRRLEAGDLPLPNIGWNDIRIKKEHALLKHFVTAPDFYFVHSYVFKEKNPEDVLATTGYGQDFTSVIGRANILGVQFHPEKSQKAGMILMKNFLGDLA